MKVKELIEKLQSLDPELMVVRTGMENGYNDINDAVVVELVTGLKLDWWNGIYANAEEYSNKKRYKDKIKNAVYLH